MFNFLDKVRESPDRYMQLSIDDQLVTEYNCLLEKQKQDIWTSQDYFAYVVEGKKIWHIPGKSFDLTEGKCIFVKKGAHIVEQFFDARFCIVVFFVSDKFITETLRNTSSSQSSFKDPIDTSSIHLVDADDTLHAFFNSVVPYFLKGQEINKSLLELKFKELILNVINNPNNIAITQYFFSLFTNALSGNIQMIMEKNFCFNLRIEDYARLSGLSLSSFKRAFEEQFNTTPGRWLLERRLKYAQILLNTSDKTISEIAFESGFENVSHFSRAFKQLFGNSPTNSRQLMA